MKIYENADYQGGERPYAQKPADYGAGIKKYHADAEHERDQKHAAGNRSRSAEERKVKQPQSKIERLGHDNRLQEQIET